MVKKPIKVLFNRFALDLDKWQLRPKIDEEKLSDPSSCLIKWVKRGQKGFKLLQGTLTLKIF